MEPEFRIRPVGIVESPVHELVDENWGAVVSRIRLRPEYFGSLTGLQDFSHVLVITYLHRAKYIPSKHLQHRPRGLQSMPKVGIFSQRVKDRPNPIGVTAVAVVGLGDDHIDVRGLDAVDATPVIDIKPYLPHFDRIETPRFPEWAAELMKDYF